MRRCEDVGFDEGEREDVFEDVAAVARTSNVEVELIANSLRSYRF